MAVRRLGSTAANNSGAGGAVHPSEPRHRVQEPPVRLRQLTVSHAVKSLWGFR